MNRSLPALVVTALALGCGGFMPVSTVTGPDAGLAIGSLAQVDLPPHSQARFAQLTSIDPISNGEFSASRPDAEAWFASIEGCAAAEPVDAESALRFFAFVGEPTDWQVPRGHSWRVKRCPPQPGIQGGYDVALTDAGDPAWVWVTGVHF